MVTYSWIRYWKPLETTDSQDASRQPLKEQKLVTLEDLHNEPFLILLGDAGLGKTETIKQTHEALQANYQNSVLINLNEGFNSDQALQDEVSRQLKPIFDANPQAMITLFIDSFDEGYAAIRSIALSITRYIVNYFPKEQIKLRLVCRAVEWGSKLTEDVINIWHGKIDKQEKVPEISYILTELSVENIKLAAQVNQSIDSAAFITELERQKLEPLASRPIVLRALLSIFAKDKSLPQKREEIYARNCFLLVSDTNETRTKDKAWKTTDKDRYKVAKQVAALSVLTNHNRVFHGKDLSEAISTATLPKSDCYIEENNWQNPKQLIDETLETALFTNSGFNYRIWAHQSYAEYLAAVFLNESHLYLHELEDLFINPIDPERKILPKLYETAIWLANLNPQFAEWLISYEPSLLINSDNYIFTNIERQRIVKQIVENYQKPNYVEELPFSWGHYKKLIHPDIEQQIIPYLDKKYPLLLRRFCFDLIFFGELSNITLSLAPIAYDKEDPFRGTAIDFIAHMGTNEDKKALRDLFDKSVEHELNHDMLGHVMLALWEVESIGAKELFDKLVVERVDFFNEIFSHGYDDLCELILVKLRNEDLSIALEWVSKQGSFEELALVGSDIVLAIMRKAWDLLDDPNIMKSFAKAAWSRIRQHNSIIADKPTNQISHRGQLSRKYVNELLSNSDNRHNLFLRLLDFAIQDVKHPAFWLLNDELPLIIESDILWLLETFKSEKDTRYQDIYVELFQHLILWDAEEHKDFIAEIYNLIPLYPVLQTQFSSFFEEVILDSNRARQMRDEDKRHKEMAKIRQEQLEQLQTNNYDLKKEVLEYLAKSEDDSAFWWQLDLLMLHDERGFLHYSENSADLAETKAWNLLAEDEQIRVLITANHYLEYQNPYIANTSELALENRRPALAGYRAMFLLHYFNLEKTLSVEVWKKWASVILNHGVELSHYLLRNSAKDIGLSITKNAYHFAPQESFTYIETILDRAIQRDFILSIWTLKQFETCYDNKIQSLILLSLDKIPPISYNFRTIVGYLISLNNLQAIQITITQVKALHTIDTQSASLLLINLIDNALDISWWEDVFYILKMNRELAKKVLEAIFDRPSKDFISHLLEEQLEALYLFVESLYSMKEDIEPKGTFFQVTPRYSVQQGRESLIGIIGRMGSLQAIESLKRLESIYTENPNIPRALTVAYEKYRIDSWQPLKPQEFLKMVHKASFRNDPYIKQMNMIHLSATQQVAKLSSSMQNEFRLIENVLQNDLQSLETMFNLILQYIYEIQAELMLMDSSIGNILGELQQNLAMDVSTTSKLELTLPIIPFLLDYKYELALNTTQDLPSPLKAIVDWLSNLVEKAKQNQK